METSCRHFIQFWRNDNPQLDRDEETRKKRPRRYGKQTASTSEFNRRPFRADRRMNGSMRAG